MVRIAVVVTARPSWAKLATVCEALRARPDVELQIVACASALLERYGKVIDVIKAQGFEIAAECWTVHEGENLITSAKETGSLLSTLTDVLHRLRPDAVVVCADRHEVLAAAMAAAALHLPLVHLQGGERSGSIDDRVRDSVTQLADHHFVCTERARHRVYGLTGRWDRIYHVGCSSIDMAKRAQAEPPVTDAELGGTGPSLDLAQPFVLVLQHPVTSEADQAEAQMQATLDAVRRVPLPRIVFWPGEDAGAGGMSKAIRRFHAEHPSEILRTVRNLPPARFLRLLTQASVLVGNSSCGIRESAYLGVPVVNIGSRQYGRERAANVRDVSHDSWGISVAITAQLIYGRYPSSALYGDGTAGEQIAEVLAHVTSDCAHSGARR